LTSDSREGQKVSLVLATIVIVHCPYGMAFAACGLCIPGNLRQCLLLVTIEPDTSRAPLELDASCVPGMALLHDSLLLLCATLAVSL
jgi:hypothetical protein